MIRSPWRGTAVAAGVYAVLTLALARDLLPSLGSRIVHDEFDPLLIAAILDWNAWHVPFTAAWWQFPIFSPAADALAFSEHLLGISLLAAPLAWAGASPVVVANLMTLLTFPLCGVAALLLARRLTGDAIGAFVGGLVYAFGPYRMGQLAHLQMLAVFWTPLVLLGLHEYVQTRRRRWLVLVGVAWLLQVLSNGYALFFLSVFVGLWMCWFVVWRRQWSALAEITGTFALASLPLGPILWAYVDVHARNGFTRSPAEIVAFSADALAGLCAPWEVSLWGWMQIGCRPEGQLFPGVFTAILAVGAVWLVRTRVSAVPRFGVAADWLRRAAIVVACLQLAAVVGVVLYGPWAIDVGPVSAHASAAARPLAIGLLAGVVALALSPRAWAAVIDGAPLGFYLLAGACMWWLSLGPTPAVLDQASELPGPFRLLMYLPGFESIRVPSRFWVMGTLSLAVAVAFVVSELGRRCAPAWRRVTLVVVSLAVLSDGWELHVPSALVPPGPPKASALQGGRVLYLPAGQVHDVVPTFYAVTQGWTAVNGYSGFEPTHYDGVRQSSKLELDGVFAHYREAADLHVVVARDAPRLRALVERQPGVQLEGENASALQYRMPGPASASSRLERHDAVLPAAAAAASCPPAALLVDGSEQGIWTCAPQNGDEVITVSLAAEGVVDGVRMTLGRPVEFPRGLLIEASLDGAAWHTVRDASDVVPEFLRAAHQRPLRPALVVATRPVPARFVRLRQVGVDPTAAWSLRELQVLGTDAGQSVR